MTVIDANRSEQNDEPWRLVRVARTLAKAFELAHEDHKANLLNHNLYSLYDHKGILTATWWSEQGMQLLKEYVENAWQNENEELCDHVLMDGTPIGGDNTSFDSGEVLFCGECGSLEKHFNRRRYPISKGQVR